MDIMAMGPLGVVVVIIWIASAAMSLVVAAALITYVIRTWQVIRAGAESHSEKILDGIDQLRVEVGILNDRLASLERPALKSGDEPD